MTDQSKPEPQELPGKKTGKSSGGATAVKRGRRGKKTRRKHSLPFRLLVWTVTAIASLFLLAIAAFAILYFTIKIPKANPTAEQAISTVYYADGKTVMGQFEATNRDPVKLNQVPVSVEHAFLAAEDRTFYKNKGVSPTGIFRAFYNDLTGKAGTQGGSTLTQQYVKNFYLSQDRTVTRKVKEIIISLKIDKSQSKDQILQNYLNSVYFGRGTYGIQAAARSYFHVDVSKLTPVQGAFLASVVNNPDNMDPTVGPKSQDRANERMAYVLNGMVTMNWMTQAERNAARMPQFYKREATKYTGGPQGYIIQSVRSELASKLHFSQADIDRGGFKIVTTIDKTREDQAVKAVQNVIPKYYAKTMHAGLVAVKPNDGAIVAMYGGANYNPVSASISDADQAYLQQASSMKLFTAIAALRKGDSIDTRYNGNSPMKLGSSYVSNDNLVSWGQQPIYNMLAQSINTAFVRLNQKVGGAATLKAALDSGFDKDLPGMKDTNVINTLGTGDARVIDMATGYNTLASGGQNYGNHLITSIRTFDDSYSYNYKAAPTRVYPKDMATDLTWALHRVTVDGTANTVSYQTDGRQVAGKTGTASGNKYIWFTGFTPNQLTTSVGMYFTINGGKSVSSMQGLPGLTTDDIYGAGLPTQIWSAFMKAALHGQPVTKIPARAYYNEAKPKATSTSKPATSSAAATPVPTTRRTYYTKPLYSAPTYSQRAAVNNNSQTYAQQNQQAIPTYTSTP